MGASQNGYRQCPSRRASIVPNPSGKVRAVDSIRINAPLVGSVYNRRNVAACLVWAVWMSSLAISAG